MVTGRGEGTPVVSQIRAPARCKSWCPVQLSSLGSSQELPSAVSRVPLLSPNGSGWHPALTLPHPRPRSAVAPRASVSPSMKWVQWPHPRALWTHWVEAPSPAPQHSTGEAQAHSLVHKNPAPGGGGWGGDVLKSVTCSVVSDSLQPMVCSPPGSSVHGIFQARILEWIAISSSRGSSRHRDRTRICCVF